MGVAGGSRTGRRCRISPLSRLAEHLGLALHELPGAHLGYVSHPSDFARALLAVLSAHDAQATPGPG